jgi:hypothetical protein
MRKATSIGFVSTLRWVLVQRPLDWMVAPKRQTPIAFWIEGDSALTFRRGALARMLEKGARVASSEAAAPLKVLDIPRCSHL